MKYFFAIILLVSVSATHGQHVVETPDRKKVKVEANGTWKAIPASDTSTLLYTGSYNRFSLRYDPKHWIKDTSAMYTVGGSWEVAFRSKDAAVIGTYVEHRTPLDDMGAEESIRSMYGYTSDISNLVSTDTVVNGMKLQKVEFDLKFEKLQYRYTYYSYSHERGSFQFMVGAYRPVYYEDKKIIERLLNSVVSNSQ